MMVGKRAFEADPNEELFQDVQQENPELVFTGPRSSQPVESLLPERRLTFQQYYNFSPFLKQWLRTLAEDKNLLQRQNKSESDPKLPAAVVKRKASVQENYCKENNTRSCHSTLPSGELENYFNCCRTANAIRIDLPRRLNDEECYEILDLNNLPSLLPLESIDSGVDVLNMTSLNHLLLLNHSEEKLDSAADGSEKRLSLAYERLRQMPKIIIDEIAPHISILDISHNQFENLYFLTEFKMLETLICDHNNITSSTYIPHLPKLEFLWLNYCKISQLYPWVKKLQSSCPNLRYLSLMGNPAAPSYLNGGTAQEHMQYRLFVISLFPNLVYLDDKPVTDEQRQRAQKEYRKSVLEKAAEQGCNSMPECLRLLIGSIAESCSTVPAFAIPQKNTIV